MGNNPKSIIAINAINFDVSLFIMFYVRYLYLYLIKNRNETISESIPAHVYILQN